MDTQASQGFSPSLNFKTLKFQLQNDMSVTNFLMEHTKADNKQQIIQALVQLKTDDLSSARQSLSTLMKESHLKEIKQSAFANLALLSTKENQCDFFNSYREEIFGNKELIHFLFSFCLLSSDVTENRQKAKLMLMEITKKNYYYQESLLGLAYIQYREGSVEPGLIQNILDSDPYITNTYHYNIWIDKAIYNWPHMLPLCETLYSAKKTDKVFISLYAYCLTRAQHHEQALQMIKKAESMDPENALVKSIYSYIMDRINLKNDSALILGKALKANANGQYVLPDILQTYFCAQKKNWLCVVQHGQKVLKHNPDSLSSLGNIAYAKYQQGHPVEAKEYMEKALALSESAKSYSPLLFLQQQYEEKSIH